MKRRELVVASAAGVLPILGRAATQPCPPPLVKVTGGTEATTTCSIVSPSPAAYATSFPQTENPLSEGGIWQVGKSNGGQWNDPATTPNKCFASVNADTGVSKYADDIAHLKTSFRTFSPNQFAQATVFRQAGYPSSSTIYHEVELLLRFSISNGDAHGYEILWGVQGYLAVVRWNGPLGTYTPIYDPGIGSIPAPVEGDVFRAEISGTVIKVYRNASLVATVDVSSAGTVYASGQPGVGFWPIGSAVPANLGWKAFSAGDL